MLRRLRKICYCQSFCLGQSIGSWIISVKLGAQWRVICILHIYHHNYIEVHHPTQWPTVIFTCAIQTTPSSSTGLRICTFSWFTRCHSSLLVSTMKRVLGTKKKQYPSYLSQTIIVIYVYYSSSSHMLSFIHHGAATSAASVYWTCKENSNIFYQKFQ